MVGCNTNQDKKDNYELMKYFKISISFHPKTKGIRDGGCQVELNKKILTDPANYERIQDHFSYLRDFEEWNKAPEFDVALQGYVMKKAAKATDFLHYSPNLACCQFMVNSKVIELFDQFNLPEHNYYPVEIIRGDEIIDDYKLLRIKYFGPEVIDFPKSIFFTGHKISNTFKYHKINSYKEFQYNPEGLPETEEIVLNENFDKTLDLFGVRLGGLIVSERLVEAIQKAKLVGARIYEEGQMPIISVEEAQLFQK